MSDLGYESGLYYLLAYGDFFVIYNMLLKISIFANFLKIYNKLFLNKLHSDVKISNILNKSTIT